MKTIHIEDVGDVQIHKHARSRSLKITVASDGIIKVTQPTWVPYSAGAAFARSKKAWLQLHHTPASNIKSGSPIGKFHHLYFKGAADVTTISTRQKGSELWVTYPTTKIMSDADVQAAARKVAMRALRDQAENLLPKRLRTLADEHGFDYKSVQVRQLKARWGSCNNKGEITLNFFLMQLPWDLIDYVLVHELTHTKALHHGPEFWEIFEVAMPGAKKQRSALKGYSPTVKVIDS